ncbi:MAG: hypothetical protein D6705_05720 [Deltaproteobacteria bacterium]|nr:MAG: hypothetical protein D6705_05720 [Deltaproteobacteria bacterium]
MSDRLGSRLPLALCILAEGGVFAWAAAILPWASWTWFSILTAALALACLGPIATVATDRWFRRTVTIQAVAALAFFLYCAARVFHGAAYLAYLYGGLGRGVAAGLCAALAVLAFVTVPTSLWGLARFGPRPRRREVATGVVTGVAAVFAMAGSARAEAAAAEVPADPEALAAALAHDGRSPAPAGAPGLFTRAPSTCRHPVDGTQATALVAHLVRRADGRRAAETTCLQADDPAELARRVEAHLSVHDEGPAVVDVVTAADPLEPVLPLVDGMAVRPGFDGICEGTRCLAPWQLVATEQFVAERPLPFVPELRFGFDPRSVRAALEGRIRPRPRTDDAVRGLTRVETVTLLATDDGRIVRLVRGRGPRPPVEASRLDRAVEAATGHILSAQQPSGRFRYILDPHTGAVRYGGFSTARQAGTTLALCEVGARSPDVDAAAARALGYLAGLERRAGDVGGIVYPAPARARRIPLGPTALSLVAFLSCRDRVGDAFDDTIARMARFLLRMAREDGGFHPVMDARTATPIPGPDPLYAGGQAVFALVLLEDLARREPDGPFPSADELAAATERSMTYFATTYWPSFLRTFFFLEENWHCLAARAALGHHRHDAYERFCLDYVTFKRRLVLGPTDRVDPTLWGGYGFGNVILPHNTGSAGFGEAVSAALAVARARGEVRPDLEAGLRDVLGFLLARQWNEDACFACTKTVPVVGAFSEHIASPHVRIDYVQHAMAAMGHGRTVLFGPPS